jgi:hypothetical protein
MKEERQGREKTRKIKEDGIKKEEGKVQMTDRKCRMIVLQRNPQLVEN